MINRRPVKNFYEIFVRSFADGNNDGIGDLIGLEQKLDYIKDMGYDGIWLMPIHPSNTYHKYDVLDYYEIDREYGTLDDFKFFLQSAHQKGISVILDLVINHTSRYNPWFLEFVKSRKSNDKTNRYYNFYNYSDELKEGYREDDGIIFEGRFSKNMPDLNLDNLEVRKEIVNIIKYWEKIGVDGFRLDAVTSYYTNEPEKNKEFLEFLGENTKNLCLVGEAWTTPDEIKTYYESNSGSFFSFYLSGALVLSIDTADKLYFEHYVSTYIKNLSNNRSAYFIGNHDTDRSASLLFAKYVERVKFGYAILGMLPGTIYAYYGDEIGMVGEAFDPNRRIGMLWDNEHSDGYCTEPPGCYIKRYIYPSVKEQINDKNSILNFYKQINNIRLKNDILTEGSMHFVDYCDKNISIAEYSYKGEKLRVYINFSNVTKEILLLDEELIETITVLRDVSLNENRLILSGCSIAITKIN